jgi:ABC-2 type transport system ATP-binding protein
MIDRGQLIADTTVDSPLAGRGREVVARTKEPERLAKLATEAGGVAKSSGAQELVVRGLDAERIGEIAAAASIVLYSLTERGSRLEEVFLELSGSRRAAGAPNEPAEEQR